MRNDASTYVALHCSGKASEADWRLDFTRVSLSHSQSSAGGLPCPAPSAHTSQLVSVRRKWRRIGGGYVLGRRDGGYILKAMGEARGTN
eukprot:1905572-Pleurochrysis_carterae.AAC.4